MNWGIIGLGKIAGVFAKEFAFINDSSVIIAGSRDKEKAAIFCKEHNIPHAGDYDDVIQSKAIEAIYIGTPHHLHYELAKKALLHGKHVLCEKPITVNAKQYIALSELAKANHLFLMDAMWTYFLPATQKAKEWIAAGEIGAIKYVHIDFAFPAAYDIHGRLFNAKLAGGALLDIGVYLLYSCFHFLGTKYTSINCAGEIGVTNVDESLSLQLDYGTAKANLYCSLKHRAVNTAFIYGENGYIALPLFWQTNKALLYASDNALLQTFEDERTSHGFQYEIAHFIDCVTANKTESNILPHHLTLQVMETMDYIRNSIGLHYDFE